MLSSINIIALLSLTALTSAAHVQVQFPASHDTFIRKDNISKSHGNGSKIAITKHGANQRIGLMKFDTADYDEEYFDKSDIKAYLRLGVAETHKDQAVQVKVVRLENDFHEDYVSWRNFDGDADVDNFVKFTVQHDHADRVGQLDISTLLRRGKDTILAFIIEDHGHVKFHSKEHKIGDASKSPTLILERYEL
jgi:hypothetical protein